MSNIQGPLLQPDVNNDNNTTRLMKVNTLYSTIITDGIATIENGYISNLIQPTQDNQIATKEYVDNSEEDLLLVQMEQFSITMQAIFLDQLI